MLKDYSGAADSRDKHIGANTIAKKTNLHFGGAQPYDWKLLAGLPCTPSDILFGQVTRPDCQTAMAPSVFEELVICAQFVFAHDIVNFAAVGGCRTDKQFVFFRCELDALATAAGIEMI